MHVQETEEMVTYLGRAVPRRGFRAYIFASDGRQKIAESFDEFDLFTHSDEWFASKEEAEAAKKPARKKPVKTESEKLMVVDGLIEEDFLPNETGE
jgi:hypothetical protein